MKKEKNKQAQNYRIVVGALLVVVLFLLFTMNEFKMPFVGKKTSSQKSKVVSDSNEESGDDINVVSSSDQMVGEMEEANSEKQEKEGDDSFTSEEKKRILSEYSLLSSMAERENRKLKVSFVRYLEAYETKDGSPEEFFQSWKDKYEQDKDSISRQKTETEMEREEKARERAREIIDESENMTLTQCQELGNKYGIGLEEVLTLREGQLKIMRYALQTGRTYEYSLSDYLQQYAKKKESALDISAKIFNQGNYQKIGLN